jgi:RNA polymerase-binding transcription factor DksA
VRALDCVKFGYRAISNYNRYERGDMSTNSDPILCQEQRVVLEQEYRDLQRRIKLAEEELMQLSSGNPYLTEVVYPDQEDVIEKCDRYQRQLRVVLQGLRRIDGGTFGTCARCKRPIAKKRLAALPTAQYCLACQEQMELTGSAA